VGQLIGADRVAAGELGRGGIVGNRLDLEDVKPAEFRNLGESERAIVHQPGGGGMRHERLGHTKSPENKLGRPFPERPLSKAIYAPATARASGNSALR